MLVLFYYDVNLTRGIASIEYIFFSLNIFYFFLNRNGIGLKFNNIINALSLQRYNIQNEHSQSQNTCTVFIRSKTYKQLDMCLRNTDAPGGNKVKIWQNL